MATISCINTNKIVESIRDDIRHEKFSKRQYDRDYHVSRSRAILGNLDSDCNYDVNYVAETTKILRKKTLSIQEYRKLQNALILNKEHINTFFKIEHSIQGLSRDLSGTSIQSKLTAANCCCNLSLGDSKACFSLCKFTAPYLIAELESTNQPLVEVCAWTIGNLCVGSSKAFSILHVQGCFKSLINLAKECSDTVLPAVSYACVRYLHAGFTTIEFGEIQDLTRTIVKKVTQICDVDSETLWLLALLSSEPENTNYIIQLVPVVYKYLSEALCTHDQNMQKIAAVLRVICNTVSESSGYVAHILLNDNKENICFTLDKLLSHPYIHLRKETLWLIGNLLNHNLESVQQSTKLILPSLTSMKLALNSLNETM